jgi:hypothetical protein
MKRRESFRVTMLREHDFINSVRDIRTIPFKECSFVVTFLTPTLFATGHDSIGVQLWSYPAFESLGNIMFGKGYVNYIQRLPDAPLILVTCDTYRQKMEGPPWEIFNFETRKSVWKNDSMFEVNDMNLIPVN